MSEQIRNGAGDGSLAKVSERNRLYTNSITHSADHAATEDGRQRRRAVTADGSRAACARRRPDRAGHTGQAVGRGPG
jgi:hypothetical protein